MLTLGMCVVGFCLETLVLPTMFPPQGSWVLQASFPQAVPVASSIAFELILCYLPPNKLQGVLQRTFHLSLCLLEKDGCGSSSGQVLQESSTFVQFSDLGAYHRAWCGVGAQVIVVE